MKKIIFLGMIILSFLIQAKNTEFETLYNLANDYHRQKKYDKVEKISLKIINDKNVPIEIKMKSYELLTDSLINTKKYKKLEKILSKAIVPREYEKYIFLSLGATYAVQREFNKVEKIILKSIENGMELNATICFLLGISYFEQGKFDEGKKIYLKADEGTARQIISGISSKTVFKMYDYFEILSESGNLEDIKIFKALKIRKDLDRIGKM